MDDMAQGIRTVFGRSSRRMEMIAENLANLKTPGYRAGEVLADPFAHILDSRIEADHERDATDMTPGSLQSTDRPLDFALEGKGFFVVRNGSEEYLTRNGSFERSIDGFLVTNAGHHVVGLDNDPIVIPDNVALDRLHVSDEGFLRGDDRLLGRLRVDAVDDEQQLQRVGTTLFKAVDDARRPADSARVLGRTLESSNTVVFQELSSMMLLNRTLEAIQRVQKSEQQAQSKMIDVLS